ncbi:MAG: glycosyltransferase family 2 protein [Hyphomonadaceae bacterium]|nr:glycosyltransferase family 2 protein [Hyphomonadaceae bacterium]
MSSPISAYIRTKNEERMIGEVIRAAQQVVSEVVVVDSGSTDRTIEIADGLGARVIKAPWFGGGKQKRIAEDAARNDWLLDLDADEVVTPELAREIGALFENGEPDSQVYELMMATCPPVGAPWLDFNLVDRRKLYNRRAIRQPDHANWDQFQTPRGMKIGQLKAPLLHYSFVDLAQLEEKFNRNSSGRARDTKLKPFWLCVLRMVLARPLYFANHYFRRGLWRAGWYGFAVSQIAAHGRWLKDAKMVEIHLRQRKKPDA